MMMATMLVTEYHPSSNEGGGCGNTPRGKDFTRFRLLYRYLSRVVSRHRLEACCSSSTADYRIYRRVLPLIILDRIMAK